MVKPFSGVYFRPSPALESDGQARVAHIVEHPPVTRNNRYWYVLDVIDGPNPSGTHLRNTFARRRREPSGMLVTEVDPDERQQAIAKLTEWASGNGWTIPS